MVGEGGRCDREGDGEGGGSGEGGWRVKMPALMGLPGSHTNTHPTPHHPPPEECFKPAAPGPSRMLLRQGFSALGNVV